MVAPSNPLTANASNAADSTFSSHSPGSRNSQLGRPFVLPSLMAARCIAIDSLPPRYRKPNGFAKRLVFLARRGGAMLGVLYWLAGAAVLAPIGWLLFFANRERFAWSVPEPA